MGVVFVARDVKLQRHVALKLLPDHLADDPDRLARFQREALVLASLNHPNIAQIYGLEESGHRSCIVMELVDGETLQERLTRGPIPVGDALPIAQQVAEALAVAHEKGVVHRDLKPANIKITPDGRTKVLDFGLAKAVERASVDSDPSNGSNVTTLMSSGSAGLILGTAAYMSPEQARGQAVDKRTDIWAFGCTFYEMLTGRPVFSGNTPTDIVSAALSRDPDWSRLPHSTPTGIRTLLRRCLQKDRHARLHDVADARLEIEDALHAPNDAAAAGRAPAVRPTIAWIVAALALAGLAALSLVMLFRVDEEAAEVRLQIVGPFSEPRPPVISPDGRSIVFAAQAGGKAQLWLRPLDSLQTRPLPGTDNAQLPFWSPDARSIGFFANGKLKRVNVASGSVEVVANAIAARGGSWNRDNVIVFSSGFSSGLYRVSASGGEVTPVTKLTETEKSHRLPQFLPDGRHFLYYAQSSDSGVYAGSMDGTVVKRLLMADSQALFQPPNRLFFVRDTRLFVQRFDAGRLEVDGDPKLVADHIEGSTEVSNLAAFSVSENHALVYRAGDIGQSRQFAWFDRDGRLTQAFSLESADAVNPSLSPDGSRVVFNRLALNFDVWLMDAVRGNTSKVTADAVTEVQPIWAADGETVVFSSNRTGTYSLHKKDASGTGPDIPLLENSNADVVMSPRDWSSDGAYLLYVSTSVNTGYDIMALPLANGGKPTPVVATSFEERIPVFSPDGKWIAYQSDETGRFEIYAQPFPGSSGRVQISTNGGTQPRWKQNEIFFIGPDAKLMAAAVEVRGQTLRITSTNALFQTRIAGGPLVPAPNKQQYDATSDGRRFLINTSTLDSAALPITIILNWKPPL